MGRYPRSKHANDDHDKLITEEPRKVTRLHRKEFIEGNLLHRDGGYNFGSRSGTGIAVKS